MMYAACCNQTEGRAVSFSVVRGDLEPLATKGMRVSSKPTQFDRPS